MKRRRSLFVLLTLVLILVGAGWLWVSSAQRQYALNRQLIAALENDDPKQALVLVNAGADPNTRFDPPPAPTLKQLLQQFLHHQQPPDNDTPTAFMLACGVAFYRKNKHEFVFIPVEEELALERAMLAHDANVNATTKYRSIEIGYGNQSDALTRHRMCLSLWPSAKRPTGRGCGMCLRREFQTSFLLTCTKDKHAAVIGAVSYRDADTVALLLDNGAKVNVQDKNGYTALMIAASKDNVKSVNLLLLHGAVVNAQNRWGSTALYYATLEPIHKDVIVQLMVHGADPNLANKFGFTPLMYAQQMKCPDIVTLLKRGGK